MNLLHFLHKQQKLSFEWFNSTVDELGMKLFDFIKEERVYESSRTKVNYESWYWDPISYPSKFTLTILKVKI